MIKIFKTNFCIECRSKRRDEEFRSWLTVFGSLEKNAIVALRVELEF